MASLARGMLLSVRLNIAWIPARQHFLDICELIFTYRLSPLARRACGLVVDRPAGAPRKNAPFALRTSVLSLNRMPPWPSTHSQRPLRNCCTRMQTIAARRSAPLPAPAPRHGGTGRAGVLSAGHPAREQLRLPRTSRLRAGCPARALRHACARPSSREEELEKPYGPCPYHGTGVSCPIGQLGPRAEVITSAGQVPGFRGSPCGAGREASGPQAAASGWACACS
jgi:hypothetical protein